MAGTRQSQLIDLTKIDQVPIYLIHGTSDETASFQNAQKLRQTIPAVTGLTAVDGDHIYFGWNNGEPFWSTLL